MCNNWQNFRLCDFAIIFQFKEAKSWFRQPYLIHQKKLNLGIKLKKEYIPKFYYFAYKYNAILLTFPY